MLANKDAYDDSFYNFTFQLRDKFIKTEKILCDEVNFILVISNFTSNNHPNKSKK